MSILIIVAALYGATVVHELGHLGAALFLRLPIARVTIGGGPELGRVVFRGVGVRFHLLPLVGRAEMAPGVVLNDWRLDACLAAGPAAEALFVAATVAALPLEPVGIGVLVYSVVKDLCPAWVPVLGLRGSDGDRILRRCRERLRRRRRSSTEQAGG